MQVIHLDYSLNIMALVDSIANEPDFIWFHNGAATTTGNEWFSAWPTSSIQYFGQQRCRLTSPEGTYTDLKADFFELLQQQLPTFPDEDSSIFSGGLAGHLSYELGLELLNINDKFTGNNQPLAHVGLYQWACGVNHEQQTLTLYIRDDCPPDIAQRVKEFVNTIRTQDSTGSKYQQEDLKWHCSMDFAKYKQAFEQVQRYIYNGDIYQANLTRQWQTQSQNSAWYNYQLLTNAMSAPFSFYHATTENTVMSVSPERFIQIQQDQILTQPIKGTRARGLTSEEDLQQKKALSSSEKDQAENLMIVDLLRNDIAKHALPGSVVVDKLFEVQSFKNVHHLVSSISARKLANCHPITILKDAFPGGSITGAPKKRAMEVINELELTPRGHYCGSAFYLSYSGYLDSNILIRTITQQGNQLTCSGGGGLVYDSEVESEYQESEIKIRRLLDALSNHFSAS